MNLCGKRVTVVCGKGKTHQSFAKDADINNIMGRYKKTGLLIDPLSVNMYRRPNFGDFSDVVDLTDTLNRIKKAEVAFQALPAATRERFGNDVAKLLDFVQNPDNLKEAVDLKLLPESVLPKAEVKAPKAEVKAPSANEGASQPPAGTGPKSN